ncbi:hypothetical protein AAVH_05975 [Aphelenchoides avenae]|nr:hypothetical protein AAVH_05975 [Aphelenchus avenae]
MGIYSGGKEVRGSAGPCRTKGLKEEELHHAKQLAELKKVKAKEGLTCRDVYKLLRAEKKANEAAAETGTTDLASESGDDEQPAKSPKKPPKKVNSKKAQKQARPKKANGKAKPSQPKK